MADSLETQFHDLLLVVLDDIRYETINGNYQLLDGRLKLKSDTNAIIQNVGIYIRYITSNLKIYKNTDCIVDYVSLYDAFRRYSRDVWGYKRLNFLVSNMAEISGAVAKNHIKDELKAAGLKVVSNNPYLERQCAYLLYWLCKTRPFRLNFSKADENQFNEAYTSYNEMVSFMFIVHILQVKGCKISIKKEAFNDIIRDIHYRVLGRTSLELLLTALVSKK